MSRCTPEACDNTSPLHVCDDRKGYREATWWKCQSGLTKPLSDYSVQEIRAELTRRRNERRKIHANTKTNLKIRALEKELERLKKELI